MTQIVVQEFITLDGVIQGPGGVDEDREGGFDLGGWAMDHDDEGLVSEWETRVEALILGRKTYDIWAPYWGTANLDTEGQAGDLIRTYNRVPKYVASRTRTTGSWAGTHFFADDFVDRARQLRAEAGGGGEIRIWGSGEVVETLARHDLVDEYRLLVSPVVLGAGKRLFSPGFPRSAFRLAEGRSLESGVMLLVYRRSAGE
jgi:dihydrofolate reductase